MKINGTLFLRIQAIGVHTVCTYVRMEEYKYIYAETCRQLYQRPESQ